MKLYNIGRGRVISQAKFNINIAIKELQQEVNVLLNESWKSHYQRRDYIGNWDILSLKSPGGEPNNILADLMYQDSFKETPLMENCTVVKSILQRFSCEINAVRLMNLKAGAIIKEHSDGDLSFEKGSCRIHIPVFTNPEVEFLVNKKRVVMDEGSCWYLNANLKHSVCNYGSSDRIHLVFDCVVNTWLEGFMESAEKEYTEVIPDITNWPQTIIALKEMNTPNTLGLAENMEREMEYLKNSGLV